MSMSLRSSSPMAPLLMLVATPSTVMTRCLVRWGLKWRYSPRLTLHAGLGYDPSPTAELDVSPIATPHKKTRLGLGGSYMFKNGMRLAFAYQFIRGHRRDVSESKQDDLAPLGNIGVFEGEYSSRTHVIGIDLMGRF
ncbi:MAG: hypothetical protein E2O38_11780 [Proteobacteria bacterium]|nr:MAG: hypothetical protein E2O38_11780 [Pseudomonadota bacterium]